MVASDRRMVRWAVVLAGGTFLLIASVLLEEFLAPRDVPIVSAAGTADLPRGAEAITEWVAVAPGEQVMWQWSSGANVVNFGVEIAGFGTIDGGDQAGGAGCAQSDQPLRLRIWWGHTNLGGYEENAVLSWTVTVGPASESCPALGDYRLGFGSLPPRNGFLLIGAAGLGSVGAILFAWGIGGLARPASEKRHY